MKIRPLAAVLMLALLAVTTVRAQDPAADLKALVSQVRGKISAGKRSAADLAPELAAFDALLAKYQGQTTEAVAEIAFRKATLYLEVLGDAERGKSLLQEVKTNFPGTKFAASAEQRLAPAPKMASGGGGPSVDQAALIGKPAPEIHFTWSTNKGLKTLSALKGKVVLVDFWATWCGPCIASFPHMRDLVEHYQGTDVVAVGVTSLQGRVSGLPGGAVDTKDDPAKEYELTSEFIKAKEMTWTVAFSEENVFNPDYGVKGIPSVAIIAPDGTVRHIDHPMRINEELIDAILKEFKRPLPAAKKT